MKSLLATHLLTIVWLAPVRAQTITSAYGPRMGSRAVYRAATLTAAQAQLPDTGTGITWDFTSLASLSFTDQSTFTVRATGHPAFDSRVQDFTHVQEYKYYDANLGDSVFAFIYQKDTPGGLYQKGGWSPDSRFVDERPQLSLPYGPARVGQAFADTGRQAWYSSNGSLQVRFLMRDTVQYLGSGTLILPDGSRHSNAILVRSWSLGESADGFEAIEYRPYYKWYLPNGMGYSSASFHSGEPSIGLPAQFGYLSLLPTSTRNSTPLSLQLVPNPATNYIGILGLHSFQSASLEVYSADGKKVAAAAGFTANARLRIAHLPAGAYTAVVQAGGSTRSFRFAKE